MLLYFRLYSLKIQSLLVHNTHSFDHFFQILFSSAEHSLKTPKVFPISLMHHFVISAASQGCSTYYIHKCTTYVYILFRQVQAKILTTSWHCEQNVFTCICYFSMLFPLPFFVSKKFCNRNAKEIFSWQSLFYSWLCFFTCFPFSSAGFGCFVA